MKKFILDFLRDEEGLTTVEYAVAGSLVAAAVVLACTNLGGAVEVAINDLEAAVDGSAAAAPAP